MHILRGYHGWSVGNQRRRDTTRVELNSNGPENNSETQINVLKPEVIAVQTSQKRPRGKPRKKHLGNDLNPKAPVPGRKRGMPPKALQVSLPTAGSDQQLNFERSDILNKTKVSKKSRRKIKKPDRE
jgi:hypothetical protein